MYLKFIQLNMNRAEIAQTDLLRKLNQDRDLGFILLQEPYTYKKNLVRKPNGFDCYPSAPKDRPRTAIYVNKKLKFTELTPYCDTDCTAIFGKIAGHPTVVASIYLDITRRVEIISSNINNLIDFAETNKFGLILGLSLIHI